MNFAYSELGICPDWDKPIQPPVVDHDVLMNWVDDAAAEFGFELLGLEVREGEESLLVYAKGFKLFNEQEGWSLTGKFKAPVMVAECEYEDALDFYEQTTMRAINAALGFNAFEPTVSRITGKTFLMPREV